MVISLQSIVGVVIQVLPRENMRSMAFLFEMNAEIKDSFLSDSWNYSSVYEPMNIEYFFNIIRSSVEAPLEVSMWVSQSGEKFFLSLFKHFSGQNSSSHQVNHLDWC